MAAVLREPDDRREPRGFDGIAQATDVLGRHSNPHSRSKNIGRELGKSLLDGRNQGREAGDLEQQRLLRGEVAIRRGP